MGNLYLSVEVQFDFVVSQHILLETLGMVGLLRVYKG
jgi:hypothetical protein